MIWPASTHVLAHRWHSTEADIAAIRRRGQKWHVQIRRKNHPSLTRSFDTRREAGAWAREEETRLDRLQAWRGPVSMHCLSLADLVRRYRDEEVPRKRGAHIETIMLDAFLRSGIANLPLAEIGPRHFAIYRDTRLRNVRPATICRELGIFQHMFGVAIKEWGLPLATNPLAGVRMNSRDHKLLTSRQNFDRPLALFFNLVSHAVNTQAFWPASDANRCIAQMIHRQLINMVR